MTNNVTDALHVLSITPVISPSINEISSIGYAKEFGRSPETTTQRQETAAN